MMLFEIVTLVTPVDAWPTRTPKAFGLPMLDGSKSSPWMVEPVALTPTTFGLIKAPKPEALGRTTGRWFGRFWTVTANGVEIDAAPRFGPSQSFVAGMVKPRYWSVL